MRLLANSNILVIGASGSGKTTTIMKIVKEELISPMPRKIYYLYAAHQPFMDSWNRENKQQIEFVHGLKLDVIDSFKGPKLLILDDLILELNKEMAQHFIAGSHHKQTTTIFVTHSVFLNNENYRLISQNAQYMILFKNKRNLSQVNLLARQILGSESDRVLEAYKYIGPFQFVLLSFHPKVPEDLLVSTDYFTPCPKIFL
jgi:DNA replication protein DnaC